MSPYAPGGSYTSESREVAVDETWDAWANPQASSNVEVVDGSLQLAEVSAVPDSAVARWTFDDADTESGTALDSWGDNDATINGAATGVSGISQTYDTAEAYSFDGTDDYIDIPNDFGIFQDPWSIAVWFELDSTGGTNEAIIELEGEVDVWAYANNGGEHQLWHNDQYAGTTAPVDTDPHHAVYVYDGADLILHIDGSLEDTQNVGTLDANSDGSRFGSRYNDSQAFGGVLDDARVYDKALSSTEVSNLYSNGRI